MKATDLMIGDWVQDLSPVVIDAISNEDICTYQCKDGYITVNPSNLKPLPLTPEILKKNGFGYIEEDEHLMHFYLGKPQFCKDMDIHIGTDKQGHYWLNTYNNSIYGLRSVHQLQHALRLCGIEKEVEP